MDAPRGADDTDETHEQPHDPEERRVLVHEEERWRRPSAGRGGPARRGVLPLHLRRVRDQGQQPADEAAAARVAGPEQAAAAEASDTVDVPAQDLHEPAEHRRLQAEREAVQEYDRVAQAPHEHRAARHGHHRLRIQQQLAVMDMHRRIRYIAEEDEERVAHVCHYSFCLLAILLSSSLPFGVVVSMLPIIFLFGERREIN